MKTRRARRLGSARTADRGRGECVIWARAGASLERCGRPGTPLAGDGLLLLTGRRRGRAVRRASAGRGSERACRRASGCSCGTRPSSTRARRGRPRRGAGAGAGGGAGRLAAAAGDPWCARRGGAARTGGSGTGDSSRLPLPGEARWCLGRSPGRGVSGWGPTRERRLGLVWARVEESGPCCVCTAGQIPRESH